MIYRLRILLQEIEIYRLSVSPRDFLKLSLSLQYRKVYRAYHWIVDTEVFKVMGDANAEMLTVVSCHHRQTICLVLERVRLETKFSSQYNEIENLEHRLSKLKHYSLQLNLVIYRFNVLRNVYNTLESGTSPTGGPRGLGSQIGSLLP